VGAVEAQEVEMVVGEEVVQVVEREADEVVVPVEG
jgi:hypothetical protein